MVLLLSVDKGCPVTTLKLIRIFALIWSCGFLNCTYAEVNLRDTILVNTIPFMGQYKYPCNCHLCTYFWSWITSYRPVEIWVILLFNEVNSVMFLHGQCIINRPHTRHFYSLQSLWQFKLNVETLPSHFVSVVFKSLMTFTSNRNQPGVNQAILFPVMTNSLCL